MRNVTFSADGESIDRARLRAQRERITLNAAFREWLERYAGNAASASQYQHLMRSLAHVKFERRFTRDEMNAR